MSHDGKSRGPLTLELSATTGGDAARRLADDIARAAGPHLALELPLRVLDFGDARAAVFRSMSAKAPLAVFDVAESDPAAVALAQARHAAEQARGRYRFSHVGLKPPAPFPDSAFDLVYAGEAFAGLGQELQHAWICELRRVARCEAILVVATHDGGAICARYLHVIERIGKRGEGVCDLLVCQKPRGLVL